MPTLTPALEALARRAGPRASRMLSALDTDGAGRILNTPANIEKVEGILSEMQATLIDGEYLEAVSEFIRSFDGIATSVASRFASFGTPRPDMMRSIVRLFQRMALVELLSPTTYTAPISQQLADTIVGGILQGSTVKSLGESMDSVFEGLGGSDVAALEATTEAALDRTLTVQVGEQFGAEFYLYSGRPIKTTRPFCREREGHVWHVEEIKEWGRLAAEDPEGNGWAGMVEGTNEKTIFIYLGGWYGKEKVCRHALLPQHRIDVPEDDLARMRAKGLIK